MNFFKEAATPLIFYTCHLLCWPDANRLPDISSAMLGLFGISKRITVGVLQQWWLTCMAKEESSYREEEKVGRGYYEQSLWLSPDWVLARNREVCLVVGRCWSQSMTAPWSWFPNFYLIFKKIHSSECSFSSVRNWAAPTYFTVHCLARLLMKNPCTFPVYLIVNCPFMYTHFHTAKVTFLLPNKTLIFIFYLLLKLKEKNRDSHMLPFGSLKVKSFLVSKIIHAVLEMRREKICVSECKPKQNCPLSKPLVKHTKTPLALMIIILHIISWLLQPKNLW